MSVKMTSEACQKPVDPFWRIGEGEHGNSQPSWPSANAMGKKSPGRLVKEKEEVQWFQWEFLRRNPAYQRDCKAFMEEFDDWFKHKGMWYDQEALWGPKDWEFFRERIAPRAAAICQRWQVTEPFPPDWSFDKKSGQYEYKLGWSVSLPTGDSPDRIAAHWDFLQKAAEDVIREVPSHETDEPPFRRSSRLDRLRYAHVKFDLARPRSELLEQARREIVFGQERYERALRREEKQQPKRRRRLSQYAKCLEVWDLREQGLNFERIAEQVYPVLYAANREKSRRLNPIVQRVREHHARARQLIAGGYKEIR